MPLSNTEDQDSGNPSRRDEFVDFWTWLFKTTRLRFKLTGLGGLIVPFLASVYYISGIIHFETGGPIGFHLALAANPERLHQALMLSYFIQIAVIAVILLLYTGFLDMPVDKRFPYGSEGQKLLRRWWGIALVSFLLLYIALWARSILKDADFHQRGLLSTTVDLFNNFNTFSFLMCFATMEDPAKYGESKNERWLFTWTTLLILFTFVEGVLRLNFRSIESWQTDWFGLVTGANAGIALAMFCGRLSSPLINPARSVTALIYLYAVVQISFAFWEKPEAVGVLMANLCLVLKCFVSLVIAWLLTTRHLILYMERVRTTRSNLNQWRNEMRDNGITLIRSAPRDPA